MEQGEQPALEPRWREFTRFALAGAPLATLLVFLAMSLDAAGVHGLGLAWLWIFLAWLIPSVLTYLAEPLWGVPAKWRFGISVIVSACLAVMALTIGVYERALAQPEQPPQVAQPTRAPTILDIYMASPSANAIVDGWNSLSVTLANGEERRVVESYYFFRIFYDAHSNAKFISYYLPLDDDLPIDENGWSYLITNLAAQTNSLMGQPEKVTVRLQENGEPDVMNSNDFVFSHRVYIYFENALTLDQQANLTKIFKQYGNVAELRGAQYQQAVWSTMQRDHHKNLPHYALPDHVSAWVPVLVK